MRSRSFPARILAAGLALLAPAAAAQTCQRAAEMDAQTRSAMEAAARQYFQQTASGDYAGLRQAAISSLASDFGSIESAVTQHKEKFRGAQAQVRDSYLLEALGSAPLERAQFFCGIWNSPERTAFVIPNLPPGRYGLVIQDVSTDSGHTLATVLRQDGQQWRLAGYYVRPTQVAGHDGEWYWQKARDFAQRGQQHNAWFYYLMARELLAPVPFMSTRRLDRLYEEAEKVRPPDLPYGKTLELAAGGETRRITEIFPVEVGNDLNLVVKYQTPDISDTRQVHADNLAIIRALVQRYPEYRDAFNGVVARAVAPSGRDFGSLQAMKDLK